MTHSLLRIREEESSALSCALYGLRVVDDLPRRCPFRLPRATEAIARIEAMGWHMLLASDGDAAEGLALLDRAETCAQCMARNAGHSTIRRLRRREGVAQ